MVIAVCNIICIPQIKWKLKLVSGQIISKAFVDFIIIVGKKYPNRIMLPNTFNIHGRSVFRLLFILRRLIVSLTGDSTKEFILY